MLEASNVSAYLGVVLSVATALSLLATYLEILIPSVEGRVTLLVTSLVISVW
ncbi:Uncharacterised protein, partial [Mycoplasmopsis synoviae]